MTNRVSHPLSSEYPIPFSWSMQLMNLISRSMSTRLKPLNSWSTVAGLLIFGISLDDPDLFSRTLFKADAAASKGEPAVGADGADGSNGVVVAVAVAVVTADATDDACGINTGVSSLFAEA